MLLPEQNKLADSSRSRKSILRTVLTIVIIAGLAWLLFTVVRDLIVYGLYFRYVDELAAKTGLNQYLINALAALGLAPFLLGFKYYFFSLSREKRTRGAALLLGMTFLYNIALYVATKDEVMGKFYTITAEGVRFSDRTLDDGREWKKITRNNEWYVTHLTVGKKVDAAGHDWFDQKSGLPLLWYSKLDKEIQFYDGPGFDRFTAEELKPVSKELYLEWRRSAQSRMPSLPAQAKELHLESRPSAPSHTSSLPSQAPGAITSSPPGVISFGKPSYKDIIGPMNAIKGSFKASPQQRSGEDVVIAPVDTWSRLVLVPRGAKNITLDDGHGDTKKYSVRWNGMIIEDFPREEGAEPKTPQTVDGFQLKSRETEAFNIKVKFF